MAKVNCYHCGLDVVGARIIAFDGKEFCCNGCRTVYEIFSSNNLGNYYALGDFPGATPSQDESKFDFLDNAAIVSKLLDFEEGQTSIASLNIPHIHCSSCIWILENLSKLQPAISSSQVNFHQKTVRIIFDNSRSSLKAIVFLLCRIGYEPYISLDQYGKSAKTVNRELTYKIAVAFFCFGNIMLLSFPEYFELDEYWLNRYKPFFRTLIFALALPSFVYSASGYYRAAWSAIRSKTLNIEIPIALGLVVMFARSVCDMLLDHGPGFFDSLASLVFFMLLGKMFQSKTYDFLNFERDYKSYFPVAVTRISPGGKEQSVPVYDVSRGDRLLLRNQELIPCDGILMSEAASIDYSFVSGEAIPSDKISGDKVFAGGRQCGATIEISVLEPVSQSYLTQLWDHAVFKQQSQTQTFTDTISRYFTPVLLLVAFAGFGFWIRTDTNTAFNVFTAVLIVACPCALALTGPFTLGNMLRIFGRNRLYLKSADVIEQLWAVDTVVFDKTGTITVAESARISFDGLPLSTDEKHLVSNVLRSSNHPLSRMLYRFLPEPVKMTVSDFCEVTGSGISGTANGRSVRIGSARFAGSHEEDSGLQTTVHLSIDGHHRGRFSFENEYRKDITTLFAGLARRFDIKILSGDKAGERAVLEQLLPAGSEIAFNQNPSQKLEFIRKLQQSGRRVMMVGDGLNDAGALAQADVGIAVSENVNVFSPACDGILDATRLNDLPRFLELSAKAKTVMTVSFVLSLLYNGIGLGFALTGKLEPPVAAVIMPLSTITIVAFVTICGNWFAKRTGVSAIPATGTENQPAMTNVMFYEAAAS